MALFDHFLLKVGERHKPNEPNVICAIEIPRRYRRTRIETACLLLACPLLFLLLASNCLFASRNRLEVRPSYPYGVSMPQRFTVLIADDEHGERTLLTCSLRPFRF